MWLQKIVLIFNRVHLPHRALYSVRLFTDCSLSAAMYGTTIRPSLSRYYLGISSTAVILTWWCVLLVQVCVLASIGQCIRHTYLVALSFHFFPPCNNCVKSQQNTL